MRRSSRNWPPNRKHPSPFFISGLRLTEIIGESSIRCFSFVSPAISCMVYSYGRDRSRLFLDFNRGKKPLDRIECIQYTASRCRREQTGSGRCLFILTTFEFLCVEEAYLYASCRRKRSVLRLPAKQPCPTRFGFVVASQISDSGLPPFKEKRMTRS